MLDHISDEEFPPMQLGMRYAELVRLSSTIMLRPPGRHFVIRKSSSNGLMKRPNACVPADTPTLTINGEPSKLVSCLAAVSFSGRPNVKRRIRSWRQTSPLLKGSAPERSLGMP